MMENVTVLSETLNDLMIVHAHAKVSKQFALPHDILEWKLPDSAAAKDRLTKDKAPKDKDDEPKKEEEAVAEERGRHIW